MGSPIWFPLLLILIVGSVTGQAQRCPNDWVHFENSCYAFLNEVVPWTNAESYCRLMHAKMLEVETAAENDFIAAQIRSRAGISAVWQGANDLLREGRWVFNSNGEAVTWFNWHTGEPNDSHTSENGEDCIQIYSDGTWDDMWCEYLNGYHPSPCCEMDASHGEVIG